jgi:hypothetical protein
MSEDFQIGSDDSGEAKEWRRVSCGADGRIFVTVTVARGNDSAKCTARTARDLPAHKRKHTIRRAVVACRERALEMLDEVSSLDLSDAEESSVEGAAA